MKKTTAIVTLTFALFSMNCTNLAEKSVGFLKEALQGKEKQGIDLTQAILLLPEYVPTVGPENPPNTGTPGSDNTPNSGDAGPIVIPPHELFSLPPGTQVSMQSFSGVIDPVGTSLDQDFDGDGILNPNETTTNIFVSDYPSVETNIAAPVTMKIEILRDSTGVSNEITSEINSNDFEQNDLQGSENIHRKEVNTKTTQYQDSYASSNSSSGSTSLNFGGSSSSATSLLLASVTGGASANFSLSDSWSKSNSVSETRTHWATRPFKNHLDREAWSVKSDSSARNSRRYRSQKREKVNETSRVDTHAGYVRAALYIKNLSTNMPVRLSNILCSLMFETPSGDLVSVQSFRLRNEDFSLFEIDVYGGTEFGPYVIDLSNLNTEEIEQAILKGYSPKILILSYDMRHVPDSNYKSQLVNFSGNNLKIIEENAKGRTAQIKIMGPQTREMYRVVAFDTPDQNDPCAYSHNSPIAPGVSLRKLLGRLGCNGTAVGVEFENYVLDLADTLPGLPQPRIFVPMVKRIGGIETKVPCEVKTFTGSDNVQRTACVQKKISEWTQAEFDSFGMWLVFVDGRHYDHSQFLKTSGGETVTFNGQDTPVLKGLDSTIWVGDHIELVYITGKELKNTSRLFGNNPLETEETLTMNTRWNKSTVGKYPFDPDVHSKFLGYVGLGDFIELTFDLKDTTYLNYDFGVNKSDTDFLFDDFTSNQKTYDPAQETSHLFDWQQALEFEISLGVGTSYFDWFNVVRDVNAQNTPSLDEFKPSSCGVSMNFIKQTYTICLQLPRKHAYVSSDSVVGLYLRPSLSNAYRDTIWPTPYQHVRKFRGYLYGAAESGQNSLKMSVTYGEIEIGDTLTIPGETDSFTVLNIQVDQGLTTLTLDKNLPNEVAGNTEVYVPGTLTETQVKLSADAAFFADWNTDTGTSFDPLNWRKIQNAPLLPQEIQGYDCSSFNPMKCLGFDVNYMVGNWAGNDNGNNPNWNNFTGGSLYSDFLNGTMAPFLSTTQGTALRIELNDPLEYGINNFFVAPLVERNYEVRSKILLRNE